MINTIINANRNFYISIFPIFLVMSTTWNEYFDVTSPEKYSFLGYYEHRLKQADFIFSFRKESHRLKTDLANLMRDSSGEMKESASRLERSRKVKVFCRVFLHCWLELGRLNRF
jgi:hypothetical protein